MIQKKARLVYHGEERCDAIKQDGNPCENMAYYGIGFSLRCGTHSNQDQRKALPINPDKKQKEKEETELHRIEIENGRKINQEAGRKGIVLLYKMKMFKKPAYLTGFMNVLPNYLDKHPTEGMGLPALSPKLIGPIDHGQPGLPISLNLENFHQGNKVFASEMEGDVILPVFYETREAMYRDRIPHRHKEAAKGKNQPLFSIWRRKDGTEIRISYVQSRQFYCTFYERHVCKMPEFKLLCQCIANGTNLQICGYDAYQSEQSLEACYLDETKPFGHEMVLYCMLVLEPEAYPWKKYKTEEF